VIAAWEEEPETGFPITWCEQSGNQKTAGGANGLVPHGCTDSVASSLPINRRTGSLMNMVGTVPW
jgi:hypothetical protein